MVILFEERRARAERVTRKARNIKGRSGELGLPLIFPSFLGVLRVRLLFYWSTIIIFQLWVQRQVPVCSWGLSPSFFAFPGA